MLRETLHVLHGYMIWQGLRLRSGIGKKTVVLALAGDNERLDFFAQVHLKDFMDRKYAKKAVILYTRKEEPTGEKSDQRKFSAGGMTCVRRFHMSAEHMRCLYDYYSFYKCSDKLVFTYTDCPVGNCLGRVMRETEITEEEAVCLGLYRLKEVPARDRRKRPEHADNISRHIQRKRDV